MAARSQPALIAAQLGQLESPRDDLGRGPCPSQNLGGGGALQMDVFEAGRQLQVPWGL